MRPRSLFAVLCSVVVLMSVVGPADAHEVAATKVADVRPGKPGSRAYPLAAVGKWMFFAANDGKHGSELWKTKGTAASTKLVKDITPGAEGTPFDPSDVETLGNRLIFRTSDPGLDIGNELWVSDGTDVGTHPIDIYPGPESSYPEEFTRAGDHVYFRADGGTVGTELWRTDGVSAHLVHDLDSTPLADSSVPQNIAAFGDKVVFAANVDGKMDPWISDGTQLAPTRLFDLNSGLNQGFAGGFVQAGDQLLFAGYEASTGTELWQSNGIPAGQTGASTTLVKDIHPSGSSSPNQIVVVDEMAYFSALDPLYGQELWRSDGTSAGTSIVGDIAPRTAASDPFGITAFGPSVVYTANNGDGRRAYVSDFGGTRVVSPPSANVTATQTFTPAGSSAYFIATTADRGDELWHTNGRSSGTHLVRDIFPGPTGSGISTVPVALGSRVYFGADNGAAGPPTAGEGAFYSGIELWRAG